jgi:murein DD-endopeptidase MepM/ murein hydrolase activator NlpD
MIVRWPVAKEFRRISQVFGAWPERYGRFGLNGHPGIDFGVPIGTPVLAANDGELQVMWGPQLGWQAWVVADWGQTFYAHLDSTTKPRRVVAGEVIAHSGNTGTETTGAHLHFEIIPFPRDMMNGYKGAVNPLPLLQEGERVMGETITAARWHVEESVREIEAAIVAQEAAVAAAQAQLDSLRATRARLAGEVVPKLYAAEGK